VVKVRHCPQDVAVGIDCFWPTDSSGGVSVRVEDEFGVDEIPRRYSLVQGFAKSSSSRHTRTRLGGAILL